MAGLMNRLNHTARCALVALLALSQSAFAQSGNQDDSGTLKETYGGIVINQTITVGGQEFYRHFVNLWRDRPMTEQFAITIVERPSPRFGSQVWIEYAQRRMFQAALPNARTAIAPLSERAVESAYQAVVDVQVQRMLFQDGDLARDEI